MSSKDGSPGLFSEFRWARGTAKKNLDDNWKAYGEGPWSYERDFRPVLDGSISSLLSGRREAVVVDLMAPAASIEPLVRDPSVDIAQAVSVSLDDHRTQEIIEQHAREGLTQVTGDLSNPKTCVNC